MSTARKDTQVFCWFATIAAIAYIITGILVYGFILCILATL